MRTLINSHIHLSDVGMAGVLSEPRLVKELDFRVIKEQWLTIKLRDDSIIKFKPVLVKVFETDAKDPVTGELVLGFEGHNVVTVRSPEKLLGNPSERIPPVPEALKMPKEEVEVAETIDPGWNLYELEDGKTIKTKAVITRVYKIKDVFDRHGNPYYVVMSQMVAGSSRIHVPLHAIFDQISDGCRLNYLQLLGLVSEHDYPQLPSVLMRQLPRFDQISLPVDWRIQAPPLEMLKRITPPIRVKLTEDVLTPLDEKLFARKTADGKIEIFEVIE